MRATRTNHQVLPDPTRLIAKPFVPGSANMPGTPTRIDRLVELVTDLPAERREQLVDSLRAEAEDRFTDIVEVWRRNYQLVSPEVAALANVEDATLIELVGAYVTQAYAYEAVALTNPSIVPHGEPMDGEQGFVMSARAIGEGHISSIAFLTGKIDRNGTIELDGRHPFVGNGERRTPVYSRDAFADKLQELGFLTPAAEGIMALLPDRFSADQLDRALRNVLESDLDELQLQDAIRRVHWLAASNYELRFDPSRPLSEHVISPAAPAESRGIEDARFVRFTEDDGSKTYYATYTAFDGTRILPQLIETSDFNEFRMATMTGPAIHHKGMALFPRRINGDYVALSRHDHERSFVLRSDSLRAWRNAEVVFGPSHAWDAIQTGNCGSPIETDHGWLVITHGVGPMRRYVLGAVLLDIDEPAKVIGRLASPLLEPDASESIGQVPDVVYSCGSLLHEGLVVTPFGFADFGIKIAVTPLADIIDAMV